MPRKASASLWCYHRARNCEMSKQWWANPPGQRNRGRDLSGETKLNELKKTETGPWHGASWQGERQKKMEVDETWCMTTEEQWDSWMMDSRRKTTDLIYSFVNEYSNWFWNIEDLVLEYTGLRYSAAYETNNEAPMRRLIDPSVFKYDI